MRWGVRDEATDDHMTTELCMKEIENCQRLSMGPNFVVSFSADTDTEQVMALMLGQRRRATIQSPGGGRKFL